LRGGTKTYFREKHRFLKKGCRNNILKIEHRAVAGQQPPTSKVVIQRYDPKQDTAVSGSPHNFYKVATCTQYMYRRQNLKDIVKTEKRGADTGIIRTTSTLYLHTIAAVFR